MALTEYKRKRHFEVTPEPKGRVHAKKGSKKRRLRFVIQKHAARRLHYDFRLEWDGVLKSWAVPKGPVPDPKVKSLAVHVEDHPMEYGSFEGTIPEHQYGAGTVLLWDRGTWHPEGDPKESFRKGKLIFELDGEKLQGRWALIRMSGQAGDGGKNWLLKKLDDSAAQLSRQHNLLDERPESVASGRTLEEIAAGDTEWSGGKARRKKKAKAKSKFKKVSATKASRRALAAGGRRPSTAHSSNGSARSKKRSASLKVSALTGAERRPLPQQFQPQLATLVRQIPEGDAWLHELKFDGYRLICIRDGKKLRLMTRRGKDWTHRFPTVAKAAAELNVKSAILDGEVVVLMPSGTTSFQELQNLLQRKRDDDLVWYVFDMPYCDGYDLTQTPLVERKALLQQVLDQTPSSVIRYSDHIVGQGPEAFSNACRRGLEGLISKRVDSFYQQRRSEDWVKVKCLGRQEFVIVGWTDPSGSRSGFGALLLGYYDENGELRYAGRVGTGFTGQSLQELSSKLAGHERKDLDIENRPTRSEARGVHWVEPKLVGEVEFTEWTNDGRLRHPSFQGLREDKQPKEIVREKPAESAEDKTTVEKKMTRRDSQPRRGNKASHSNGNAGASPEPAGVRLTHPDRVLYPEQGLTKQDLANYYVRVADWVLPHVTGRPLTLVRCPTGAGKPCFYQKHLEKSLPPPVRGIKVKDSGGTHQYVAIDDLQGLVTLVQMSALEIHPWGSREDKLEQPDRLIIDLDPGSGVSWGNVVKAARELRGILEALGLQSFVRTTGGKGLHVVAPLVRRASWDTVKELAQGIADHLARHDPDMYVATSSKSRRTGKIYVDYLRNSRGATAVASYTSRAKSGAPVATPLSWDELSPRIDPAKFNIETVPERVASIADPWEGFFEVRQSVSTEMIQKLS